MVQAKTVLGGFTGWQAAYRDHTKRISDGADEELLPGGALCISRYISVPLDHFGNPNGPSIEIFFREIVMAKASEQRKLEMPIMICLLNSLGDSAPRPTTVASGYLARLLEDHRVLLVDPRGTGNSAPISAQVLSGMPDTDQAAHIAHFRADSIVEDCEAIRVSLGAATVCLLGESFGSCVALTYLSRYPSSLSSVLISDGLPPVVGSHDDIVRSIYERVIAQNQAYYERYPGDIAKVREIVNYLEVTGGVALPRGGRLTSRRFLSLGILPGSKHGSEAMHWLIEQAFVDVNGQLELNASFLMQAESMSNYETAPLSWLLHDAMYCRNADVSNWTGKRLLAEAPFSRDFDYVAKLRDRANPPIFFTGEMVYDWFAEDFSNLGALKGAAGRLATKSDWRDLYNNEKLRSLHPSLQVAVHVAESDVVMMDFTQGTSALLGETCKLWVTPSERTLQGDPDGGFALVDTLLKIAAGKPPPARGDEVPEAEDTAESAGQRADDEDKTPPPDKEPPPDGPRSQMDYPGDVPFFYHGPVYRLIGGPRFRTIVSGGNWLERRRGMSLLRNCSCGEQWEQELSMPPTILYGAMMTHISWQDWGLSYDAP
eukprot:gnl/TRDRNA2_/TRDRNA2_154562_c1_seq1.p1 gnl/TRDRNA2_/TRDRNA2_154562_c1~~gnl/TRDRNA2_/TRDRNA2_154562_c1_seq1.p1  ORF type:complete len:600 (+),score=84.02 gnl/TRDRNA2_/TRDRNA2_154562_c1_seq1:342-2141(+)